jgi:hypothetical protein
MLWSIFKTMLVTMLVVMILQIEVGHRTLESRLLVQTRTWSRSLQLDEYGELTRLTLQRTWLSLRLRLTQFVSPSAQPDGQPNEQPNEQPAQLRLSSP